MIEIEKKNIQAVTVDVTYGCNLRCKHCFNYSGQHTLQRKEMSDQELIDICYEIIKVKPEVVCLCGGEPLLRKDVVFKMIEILKDENIQNVNIVSNGFILDREVAEELKKRRVDFVQISVDGVRSESHDWLRNKEGAHDRALAAIKNLVDAGVRVGVSFIPTKKSIGEMEDLIALLDEMGVSVFRTQPLMKMGRATGISDDDYPTSIDYFKLSKKISKLTTGNTLKNLKLEWGDPLEHLLLMSEGEAMKMLIVNGYGDLMISPYLAIRIGNVKKHSVSEYLDKGLLDVYGDVSINKLCKKYGKVSEMNLSDFVEGFPELYKDEFIDLDIFEVDPEKRQLIIDRALNE